MASRSLDDLHPAVKARAERFLSLAEQAGIHLLVTCTYRSWTEQDDLYAQGRTKPGAIVTNARGGNSMHNHRCALDIVPLVNGKPMWDNNSPQGKQLYREIGRLGKLAGLDWAGDWTGSLREDVHFQFTGGLTLAQLQAGKIPS